MPITFACECGKQLKTADDNAGKRVKCPACGEAVAVPASSRAPAGSAIRFRCDCGKQLQAKPELVGRKVRCPGCAAEMTVPGGGEDGIQATKPAAKKPDLAAATRKSPKPKAAPPPDDEDRPRKKKRDLEDEADDADEEDRPRKRMKSKPPAKSNLPLILGIGGGLLLLVVGGSLGAWWYFSKPDPTKPGGGTQQAHNQQQQPQQPQVTDLDLVPRDAVGFISVRVPGLLGNKQYVKLEQNLLKLVPEDFVKESEKHTAIKDEDIDRTTYIALDDKGAVCALFSANKPYDQEKILKEYAANVRKIEHGGKTIYLSDKKDNNTFNDAIHFVNERILLMGTLEGVKGLLDRRPQPNATGPLSDALKLTTEDYDAVVGVNPPADKIAELRNSIPPDAKVYEPLLELQTITATVRWTDTVRLQVNVHYPDDTKAAAAKDSAAGAIGLVKTLWTFQRAAYAKDPNFAQILKEAAPLEKAIFGIAPEQDGKTLRLVLQLDEKLVASIVDAVGSAGSLMGGAAGRAVSSNNLRQLAIAFHNHHDAFRQLPDNHRNPTGQPLLSWRVQILPYIEQNELYKQFKLDEPWNSPHNLKLVEKMPKIFENPDRLTAKGQTFYQVITTPAGMPYNPMEGALFGSPKNLTFTQISDGTANTLMIVEAGTAVPWTAPQDVFYNPKGPVPRLGDPTKPTFFVAFCDGAVRAIKRTLDETTLRRLISPADGNVIDLGALDK